MTAVEEYCMIQAKATEQLQMDLVRLVYQTALGQEKNL